MKIVESDLQKEAEADVWPTFAFWQLWCCPKFLTFSLNAVELDDEKVAVNAVSLKTRVVTLILKLFSNLPVSETMNEGQGANPIILLEIELSDRQKQADAAVLLDREFKEEAKMPKDDPKTPRKS